MSGTKRLWLAILALIILSPLGMLAPGTAFGEWGPEELHEMLGFVPEGLEELSGFNSFAVLPDYSVPGWEEAGLALQSVGYIFSAVVGIALVVGVSWLIGKALAKGGGTQPDGEI